MSPALIQEIQDDDTVPTSLKLGPVEATLCQLLLDVARYIDDSPPSDSESQIPLPEDLAKAKLVLRFTGGWIRDKLLGVPSHDIDVAINKMTGYQFGLKMKEYLEIPGHLQKYGLEAIAANDKQSQKAGTTDKSKTVGGLHKIEANPEKSKHLETTTVRILGLDVDLVNLRKETYTDDSRNPQMEFGTPEEDALRRDATVNAMFYNVNTREIEDFTGRGHQDMKDKMIRTPLEPYQTFKDDPLRVLRLIRFASRLGYTIEPEALNAMCNAEIKDALRRKISRERVGTELEKALQGPDPHQALRLISELDLYETIFSDPAVEGAADFRPDVAEWRVVVDALKDVSERDFAIANDLMRNKEEQYLAWQLAALVPYRDAPLLEASEPGRRAPPPLAVTVAKEGIKAPNKICDVIGAAVRNQNEISNMVDRLYGKQRRPDKKSTGEDPGARDVLGMAIRRWGTSARSQLVYSMLVDIADDPQQLEAVERKYANFVDHLRKIDVLDACSLKPLLDGKMLGKALETPPGPWMKDALDVAMAWQLRNPNATDPQAAIEEVKNHRANGELTSDLIRHFLKLTIRPLFVKASPSTVTDQGRKVTAPALPKKYTTASMDDSVNKPWKSAKDAYGLDLLRWAVRSLDEKILAEVWPLVVPPILTLVDDWEAKYKKVGAALLQTLLQTTPPALLERTGLGEVFEDALMPCLTYLPTVTEVDESVTLLSTVYPSLLALGRVRYPKDPALVSKLPVSETNFRRVKFHDMVVRKGIIYGYSLCSAYPKIVTILFNNLTPILDEMGIDSVKHIKYILPTLTETLSHPLASESYQMLESTTTALQALIRNCWPRMVEYRGEVLKGVSICWHKVCCADTEPSAGSACAGLKRRLVETVEMLETAVGPECDFAAECAALVGVDPRLAGLFRLG